MGRIIINKRFNHLLTEIMDSELSPPLLDMTVG